MANISQWSVTAGSNNSAAPNGAPEGMSPSGVNDVIRENMSAGAKVYKDQKGALVSGGTGTAYTLTTNNAHAALGDIGFTVFRVNTISTGAATVAVDGLAAKSLKISGANVTAGDLPQDVLIGIAYNSTTDAFDVFGVGREELEDITAITHADGKIIVSDGTDWVGESGSTARASLGLAIGTNVQAYDAILDGTTASFTTADESKLDGIEAAADVTDATNVNAAGAVMNSDASTSSMSFVVDEDDMISNLATKVPTQQSTKAYVDATVIAVAAGGANIALSVWNDISTYSFPRTVTAPNNKFYQCDVASSQGQEPSATPASWSEVKFTGVWNTNKAYIIGDLALKDNVIYSALVAQAGNDPDGDATNWVNTAAGIIPDQSGNAGKFLTTNATVASWAAIDFDFSVNYPQNSKSADYTLVIGDAGRQIFHPATDTTARNFTIPANANVAFDIGTVVLIVNEQGAGYLTVRAESDTLSALDGTTGPVLISGGNILTAIKVTATKWLSYTKTDTLSFNVQVAVAHDSNPYVSAYPWSDSGFGTKFSNPSTLPTNTGNGVAFSPAGTEVAISQVGSPFVTAYPWTPSGFGTKLDDPSTPPTSYGNAVAFTP